MRVADTLGPIYDDAAFTLLFAPQGPPATAPWRWALSTVLQFAEALSDRAAADAVRSRLDWKYVLRLELTDPGFDHTVLSEFRARLLAGGAEHLLFDLLLAAFRTQGVLKARGRQRTDSPHVLAVIRGLTRLELVGETLRHALNSVALVAPDWLRAHSSPEWVERYAGRLEDARLPSSEEKRQQWALTVGADGCTLLTSIDTDPDYPWLRTIPAVRTRRQVWIQNYQRTADTLSWRRNDNIPPAALYISSPYDVQAHYAKKRTTSWIGYKVHVTETCEDEAPHLITHVETTPAATADGDMTPVIHAALAHKDLLPAVHLVDTAYLDAELLANSQQAYAVDLLGPTRPDYRWQAQAGQGFDAQSFQIEWARRQAICPTGHVSTGWTPTVDRRGNEIIRIKFSVRDCRPCPSRAQCTRAVAARRMLSIRPDQQYRALQAARDREATTEFSAQYRRRAGIEGTLSQGVRAFDLRRSRYVGQAKTHLQHVLTAAAINLLRFNDWLVGKERAKTRQSAFAQLYQTAA
jgi:transposase